MTFTPPTKFPAEYVIEDGREAVVHFEMPNGDLVGHVDYYIQRWSRDGQAFSSSRANLRDKPKRITRWQSKYANGFLSDWCESREEADCWAGPGRICVWRVECDEDFRNPDITVEDV